MSLSTSAIAMLVDMIENRLSDMVITDREDAKEHSVLRHTLEELAAMHASMERSASRRKVSAVSPARRSMGLRIVSDSRLMA